MSRQFNHLSTDDRIKIKKLLDQGHSLREIGELLGYAHSSIYAEIKRGSKSGEPCDYDPQCADHHAKQMTVRNRKSAIFKDNPKMAEFVASMIIAQRMSVPEIAKYLDLTDDKELQSVSINTIYRAIDQGLIPGVTRSDLYSDRTKMFSGGNLRIPKRICEQFGFNDGDFFKLAVSGDGIIMLYKEKD